MNQNKRMKHHSRRMATCAVLCALAVVLIFFGTVIEVLDLTAAALASILLLPILLCYGPRYALLSYAVTSVLGVVLMPQSLASWLFAGLVGYYPVIKQKLDKLPKILGWLIKLILIAAVMLLYLAVFHFLVLGGEGSFWDSFLAGFGEVGGSPALAWVVIGLSVFTFVIFDFLLDRLLLLYRLKWQKRIEKWMKP